jgi:hypothetical protein
MTRSALKFMLVPLAAAFIAAAPGSADAAQKRVVRHRSTTHARASSTTTRHVATRHTTHRKKTIVRHKKTTKPSTTARSRTRR